MLITFTDDMELGEVVNTSENGINTERGLLK